MKINISKDINNEYFAELVGDLWIHAVWSTPELAMEYLVDVYEKMTSLRKDKLAKNFVINKDIAKSGIFSIWFKKITVSI